MTPLLRLEGISKRYGGVRALADARLECARGRIHAVLGENGAGKSTLIKVVAGVVKPDAGTIELAGKPIVLATPAAASRSGIVSVFQELSLLPDLTVADNIGITDPPKKWGMIDQRAQRRLAEEALARVGAVDIHPLDRVRDLALSRRQMVEIAKALARDPTLLILDEATSALTAPDVAAVFTEVRPGEVVGLGGLDGQGQRDLLLALFGALTGVGGSVAVNGKAVMLSSPRSTDLAGGGIALIPEDRKTEGLIMPMSLRDNLSFAAIDQFSRFGLIDRQAEEAAIGDMIRLLGIRAEGIDGPVAALSGGNQQKVVIGKWLMTKPQIILLNDPTRGVDVGTKQELYQLLHALAEAKAAVLFYTTDYAELIGCCDRVLILYDGAIVRVLERDEMSERNIVASAHNVATTAADVPA